jgi:hypothetical protein
MAQNALNIRFASVGRRPIAAVALSLSILATAPGAAGQRFLSAPELRERLGFFRSNVAGESRTAAILPLCRTPGPHGSESHHGLETFLDMTPAELAKQVPELKHLEPASSQAMLPQILQQVGAGVADFYDNFSNTTSTERFVSAVDVPGETDALYYDAKYNYVALVKPAEDRTRLQEYRTDPKGKPVRLHSESTIITIGFVSMTTHFHPKYQPDSNFRYLGREVVQGQNTYVVAFAQRPAVARQTSRVVFKDRTATIFVQGVGWIDPASFRILRLRTDILQPDDNVGLVKETTEIEYSQVTFEKGNKSLWLPREVKVDGQLNRYTFHNRHTYSNYRLFVVQTEESTSPSS